MTFWHCFHSVTESMSLELVKPWRVLICLTVRVLVHCVIVLGGVVGSGQNSHECPSLASSEVVWRCGSGHEL